MNDKDKSVAEALGSKSSVIENIWQNYDAVFKDSVSMFKNKSLDFFGLPKDITIAEPLKTETKEIVVKSEFADLTFRLSNGKGLHFESEAGLSKDDMFRFCHYHIDLIRVYGVDFTTVILVKDSHKQEGLDYEMIQFKPLIINCAEYDADGILAKLKEQAAKGEALNELELIYLPLFKSKKYNPAELLTESIRLINASAAEDNQKLKISALAIVLSNKLVDADKLEEIWRELKMMRLKLIEYAVEQSILEGKEIGIEAGKKEMAQINKLYIKGKKTPDEIADELNITVETVKAGLTELGYDFNGIDDNRV